MVDFLQDSLNLPFCGGCAGPRNSPKYKKEQKGIIGDIKSKHSRSISVGALGKHQGIKNDLEATATWGETKE